MPMLIVDIRPDSVIIEGFAVMRPSRISVSQWLAIWEKHARGGKIG